MPQLIYTKNSDIKTFEALRATLEDAQKAQPNEMAAIAVYAPALTGDVSESRKYVFFIHMGQVSCLPIRAIEITEETPSEITEESPSDMYIDWQLQKVSVETDSFGNKNYLLKSSEEALHHSIRDKICQKLTREDFLTLAKIIQKRKNCLKNNIMLIFKEEDKLSDSVLDKIADFSARTTNPDLMADVFSSFYEKGFSVEKLLEKAEVFTSAEDPSKIAFVYTALIGAGFQSEQILENLGALSDGGLFNRSISKSDLNQIISSCKLLKNYGFQSSQILEKINILVQAKGSIWAVAACIYLKTYGFDAGQLLDSLNNLLPFPSLLADYCVKNGDQPFSEVLKAAIKKVDSLNLTREQKIQLEAIHADLSVERLSFAQKSHIRNILVNAKDLRLIIEIYSNLKNAGFSPDQILQKIEELAQAKYPDLIAEVSVKLKDAGFKTGQILKKVDVLTQAKFPNLVGEACVKLKYAGFDDEQILNNLIVLAQAKHPTLVAEACIQLKYARFETEQILEKIDELSQAKNPKEAAEICILLNKYEFKHEEAFAFIKIAKSFSEVPNLCVEFKSIFKNLLRKYEVGGVVITSGKISAEGQGIVINLICQYLSSGGSASQFQNEIIANENTTGFFNRKKTVYSPEGVLFKAVYQSNQRHGWTSTSVPEECFSGKYTTLSEMIEKLEKRLHKKVKGLSSVINSNEKDKRLEEIRDQATYKTLSQLGLSPESWLTDQEVNAVSPAAMSAASTPSVT